MMHDGLLTVDADQAGPPPAPWRPFLRVLGIVFTLAVVAAAVLASVVVYNAVRGPDKPAAAPTSRSASSLPAGIDPALAM